MVRERNMLHSEKHAARRVQATMKDPSRIRKVRKSMARIKVVLGERSRAHHAAMEETEAAGGAAAAAPAGGVQQEASRS